MTTNGHRRGVTAPPSAVIRWYSTLPRRHRDGVQFPPTEQSACRYNDTGAYHTDTPHCRRTWPTLLIAAFLLALAGPTPGDAQPYSGGRYNDDRRDDDDRFGDERGHRRGGHDATVRCESNGNYRHCRADTRDGVQLSRQLSKSACRYNDTWGYDRRGIWVDRGCRAEFTLN
ncbi:MAG: DUF3011 domain-containing protein [Candidatus Competibacteraceae bacterium]